MFNIIVFVYFFIFYYDIRKFLIVVILMRIGIVNFILSKK